MATGDHKHTPPLPHGESSQTAQDYINGQLSLEKDAREVMPYAFDCCTHPMGPLRQLIFACLTCTPPDCEPAGMCYSCSISCHGSHGDLVELFAKRDFVCDCGTTRYSGTQCTLRKVRDEPATSTNSYNQNFKGLFCEGEIYEAEKEVGTMYQCMLGDACGEDWYHDSCIVGRRREELGKTAHASLKTQTNVLPEDAAMPAQAIDGTVGTAGGQTGGFEEEDEGVVEDDTRPEGFPAEDEFEHFICWRCVSANPWLRCYAGSLGFLEAVSKLDASTSVEEVSTVGIALVSTDGLKRKHDQDENLLDLRQQTKRARTPQIGGTVQDHVQSTPTDHSLISSCRLPAKSELDTNSPISLFMTAEFRAIICRCSGCFPVVAKFPVLLEEEDTYEPPLDEDNDGGSTHESMFDAGERALSTVDRVKAIEAVMAYNVLKEKIRSFLKPFADEKRIVGAEDVTKYFEELRGDGGLSNIGPSSSNNGPCH